MPSTSKRQARFMQAIAHNPTFARKTGVPQKVGKEFAAADKGKKFAEGGAVNDDDLSWLFDDKAFGDDTDAGQVAASQKRPPVQLAGGGRPAKVKIPGHSEVETAPIPAIERASENYMKFTGRQHEPIASYPEFDEGRAARIAHAYDAMKHDPQNPSVKRAYDAMIEETMGQYRALKDQGLDFRFIKPGESDPYAASPALGYLDLRDKGVQRVFPTDSGFGSLADFDPVTNPLLKRVGRVGDLPNATANDAFRVVHDAYGHFGPGNPFFRHKGEERAWVNHSRMYSPDALPAMTSETRGQNSWLNFGPFGETNRKASSADTTYADQKTGLMPEWTHEEGRGYAGGGKVKFVNDLDQLFGDHSAKAGALVREHAQRTGKEALSVGDEHGYSPIVRGNERSVAFPENMGAFAADHETANTPFFSVHSHPILRDNPALGVMGRPTEENSRLWPSYADLAGMTYYKPNLHHMMIEAEHPDTRMMVRSIGDLDPLVKAKGFMQYRPFIKPETIDRLGDVNKSMGMPKGDEMGMGMLINDKLASFGLPIEMDARSSLTNGVKLQDYLPDLKDYLGRHNALPFAMGGSVGL